MTDQEALGLAEEFARYRATAIAEVEVPGPAAVRRTVRRNRCRTITAAAAALLIGPVVGYAALSGDPAPRPEPVEPTLSSPTPTPSTASPTPTSATSSPAPPPNGHLTRSQLLASPVTLPPWRAADKPECPSGRVRLTGAPLPELSAMLVSVDHADVDRDGATETIARVRCYGEGGPEQVVAFDRDAAGRIVTLGQVAAVPGTVTKGWLEAVEVRSDGQVRVQVTDRDLMALWPQEWAQHQWRTYRWDGEGFDQVLGEVSLLPNPYSVDLSVTATDLHLTRAPDGSRSGTVEVRIRHMGGRETTGVELQLNLPWGLFPDGDGWSVCRNDYRGTRDPVQCRLGPTRPGTDLRLRLGLTVPQGYGFTAGKDLVIVYPDGPGARRLIERDEKNNQAQVSFG
jgi:hypothetical protein